MKAASRIALALLAAILAACAPEFDHSPTARHPLGPGQIPFSSLGADSLIADDGTPLALRTWMPVGPTGVPVPVKAAIVALHGFNDYAEAFTLSAPRWAEHGIATFAYDQRGFGHDPHPGRWPGTATLTQDLRTAIRIVRARLPGVPVYVLGESMGGAVALAGLGTPEPLPPAERPDGAILVAPAAWGREVQPLLNRSALFLAARVIPAMSFTGRGLGIQASDNIPMLRALGRDPLFIKETRSDTIFGLVDLMDASLEGACHFAYPALLLYGAKDQVVPKEATTALLDRLPGLGNTNLTNGSQRLAYYKDGWHMLLRDLEGPWVAEDVAAWIEDHQAALPTGADRNAINFHWHPADANARANPPCDLGG